MPRVRLLVDARNAPLLQLHTAIGFDAHTAKEGFPVMGQSGGHLLFQQNLHRLPNHQPQQPDQHDQARDQPDTESGTQRGHGSLPNT